jgi:outer membrane lipoprotein-sorting protein
MNMKGYMGRAVVFCLFLCFCIITTSFTTLKSTKSTSAKDVLNNLIESISKVKTLRYNLQCNERIKGKMQHTESSVKLQVSPRKLYISVRGPELIWIEGANNGNALVNPGSFPYINLNLDPNGSLMRKDQHHTINEMGLQYLAEILKDGIKRAGDDFDKHFVLLGEEKYDGRMCYKVSISFSDFSWNSYTVKAGENMTTIARKLHVSEYLILENNTKYSWYSDVKPGDVIQVPDAYAKYTLLLIDKELLLPVNNKIFDDKGLFETYEYYNLKVNTPILPEEFTKDYKDYHF